MWGDGIKANFTLRYYQNAFKLSLIHSVMWEYEKIGTDD